MILLLDNYDSFTYNLSDYLYQLHNKVMVFRNDAITIEEIAQLNPSAIVISPGPKTPRDAGITTQVIHHFHRKIPVLGICLGFQALGEYFGASLCKSVVPVHGKTSLIYHNGSGLFQNIPNPFPAMRYHSLFLQNINEEAFEVIAQTEDGIPMAIQHTQYALHGLQFHPESILTPHGMQILKNWKSIAYATPIP
jgi:anthranilate synthase/aminodeoxychorismate synthase-like glutamine amidotransferase